MINNLILVDQSYIHKVAWDKIMPIWVDVILTKMKSNHPSIILSNSKNLYLVVNQQNTERKEILLIGTETKWKEGFYHRKLGKILINNS